MVSVPTWQQAFSGAAGLSGDQTHRGMHRVCELELLAQVAKDIGALQYIELGSGEGWGLRYVMEANPGIGAVGYESTDAPPIAADLAIKRMDVFSGDFVEDVWRYICRKPLFVYTDNGHKTEELRIMAGYIAPGDILGTHDWPNEVVDDSFLTARGFIVAGEYEDRIRECGSLQRFWRRA
jgi:hypothetical protein